MSHMSCLKRSHRKRSTASLFSFHESVQQSLLTSKGATSMVRTDIAINMENGTYSGIHKNIYNRCYIGHTALHSKVGIGPTYFPVFVALQNRERLGVSSAGGVTVVFTFRCV